ncbi:MAG: hypothetical protein DCC50_07625, partial [Acidobacteria bacterium]
VDGPLVLRGRVVNDGDTRQRLGSVQALAAWTPLGSRAEVAGWIGGADEREPGWILGVDGVGPVVAPGRDVPFRVEVPEGAFSGLPDDLTALAVEVRALDEHGVPVARLRTAVSVARAEEVPTPLEHAWVVPLGLPADPALASEDDTERQEAWHSAVGTGSAVRTWLDALDLPEVSWVVDPSLLVQLDPSESLTIAPEGEPGETAQTPAQTSAPGSTAPAGGTGTQEEPDTEDAPETTAPTGAGTTGGADGADGAAAVTAPPPSRPAADQGLDVGRGLGSAEDEGTPPEVVTREVVEDDLAVVRSRLSQISPDRLWWLPVADPDVAALLELGVGSPTARTVVGLPLAAHPERVDDLLDRGRHDVAWPALDAPSEEDLARLDRLWAGRTSSPGGLGVVVVPLESLSGGSGRPVGGAAARVEGLPDVTALGADSRAGGLLATAEDTVAEHGVGAAVQQLIADNLTAYLQQPAGGRSIVYGPRRGTEVPEEVLTELSEGLQEAPWTVPVGADELVSAAAGTAPLALSGVAPDPEVLGVTAPVVTSRPPALDAGRVRDLIRLDRQLQGLRQVLSGAPAVGSWQPVLAQLWSTRWRGAPESWPTSWRRLRTLSTDAAEGVHVNPSTVNFLSDSGIMQVTVVNDLPVDVVDVRVQVVPDTSLLRIVDQPAPISVGAGSRATVSFTAQAVTRGKTTVTAQLTAPNGTRLGDDARVTVRVRPTGVWIYWVLGTAAGLVLVLGLVRALRGQPRTAALPADPDGGGR